MIQLVRDPQELLRLVLANKREDVSPCFTDVEQWLADPRNFALSEGDDLGLATAGDNWPGPLAIHVFYKSRGKKALEVARRMIGQCFDYGATEINVKTAFRDVALFARWLGFKETHREGQTIFLVTTSPPPVQ